ncbi:TatD family hydrolase [Mycoplasmopsis pullorum]|uniref:TatD family hydrolase n=1 Tax=Mycoplasmopsis pullorum TaxID=48003 RepID=UPI00111AEB76|nr:TatD family hydrolase [Mycoplasmopsis pullorum]TNK83166.1 TatD family deoxyribonuclease [Mycoplasmopsis pullorum]TNK88001.1 TatD family deoxyribonuclease [Mycoplasmopsis pullorum]TNK92196.1 TatD family deoxyribonuclease [Mycoplasmopsis pullorum]
MSKKRSNFIDAHNHLVYTYYDPIHVDWIIEQMVANNIEFMILNGGHSKENEQILEIAQKFDHLNIIKPVIGIHPEDCQGANDFERYEHLINDKVVGIGEIGLDYYYENAATRENQLASFENQLKLAKKLNLPVVIHIRDKENEWNAYADVYNLLKKYPVKHMLHTYSGNLEWTQKFIELDSYFSFSGTVTYGSNQQARDVIKIVPLNRILVETDAPYLRPHPYANEKNEPNKVIFTTYYIAGLLGLGMDKFVAKINSNLRELFKLK